MSTFISHSSIRHSNLIKGSLLIVFMCAGVYVLAVGVAVCVGMREQAYIRTLSLSLSHTHTIASLTTWTY